MCEEPIQHRQPIPVDVILKLPYITANLQIQLVACEGVLGRHSNGPFSPKSITVKTLLCIHREPFILSRVRQGGLEVNMRCMIISQRTAFHARLAVKRTKHLSLFPGPASSPALQSQHLSTSLFVHLI